MDINKVVHEVSYSLLPSNSSMFLNWSVSRRWASFDEDGNDLYTVSTGWGDHATWYDIEGNSCITSRRMSIEDADRVAAGVVFDIPRNIAYAYEGRDEYLRPEELAVLRELGLRKAEDE